MPAIFQVLCCLFLLSLAPSSTAEDDIASREAKFSRLEKLHNASGGSSFYIAEQSKKAFDEAYGDLDPYTQAELLSTLRALKAVSLYSGDRQYVKRVVTFFDRYQVKYQVTPGLVEMVVDSLSNARMLVEANAVIRRYPIGIDPFNIRPQDNLTSLGENGFLEFDTQDKSFTRNVVHLVEGVSVVVAANPLCGFSRRAIEAFEKYPTLGKILDSSTWLLPPASRLNPKAMQAWNIAHPRAKLGVIVNPSDWPSISIWETPVFYIYKGGKLATVHVGWRGEQDIEKILAAVDGALVQP